MGYPQVTKQTVIGFSKAWDRGGIKMILDDTSIQFAMDFANTVLKSFVDDLAVQAVAIKKAKELGNQGGVMNANAAAQPQPATVAPSAPQKSSIVLTDM